MLDNKEVSVKLINQKIQFSAVSSANPDHPIIADVQPPIGDGQGFGGLELMLMSFAVCSAIDNCVSAENEGENNIRIYRQCTRDHARPAPDDIPEDLS